MGWRDNIAKRLKASGPPKPVTRYPFSGDGDAVKISRLLLRCFRLLPPRRRCNSPRAWTASSSYCDRIDRVRGFFQIFEIEESIVRRLDETE